MTDVTQTSQVHCQKYKNKMADVEERYRMINSIEEVERSIRKSYETICFAKFVY